MKIAALGHYPIAEPLHGGQRRVAAIAQQAQQAGHEFHFIPIFSTTSYPDASEEERTTALPESILAELHNSGFREDVHMARVLGVDHPLVETVLKRLRALKPDIVQFEQPWLYPLFETALAQDPVLRRARLVYSSQNVEAALIGRPWNEEARKLEHALVQKADLVAAVSTSDAAVFDGWRKAGQRPVVVAPNGCWAPDLSEDNEPERVVAGDYALVAGSAHPPNATGYWDCIGPIPGFLPPGTHLVIAGGMNQLLVNDDRHRRFPMLNQEFVLNIGQVSETTLTSLLNFAKVICLPITEGGGTNLKTAEALMWLKPVIAMRPAMRGFEGAEALSGVFVADDSRQFRALLRDAMTGQLVSDRRAEDVARYGWPAQLAPLMDGYVTL